MSTRTTIILYRSDLKDPSMFNHMVESTGYGADPTNIDQINLSVDHHNCEYYTEDGVQVGLLGYRIV